MCVCVLYTVNNDAKKIRKWKDNAVHRGFWRNTSRHSSILDVFTDFHSYKSLKYT